ncbi:MAG: four helix bundle protein [Candidatus Doudnabacteria bacterium]|nr:four helix bundle protein [Candidatus Doudnabacteria bacterium]
MKSSNKKFDLEERTGKFGEEIILLLRNLEKDIVISPVISQLVRSATSIGANYTEANNASSEKDFKNKIFICKKEVQETKHWMKLVSGYYPTYKLRFEPLAKEAHEFVLIFQKIITTLKNKH